MDNTKELIEKAAVLISQAKYAIGFTGAGISVESGIPPFRGEDGPQPRQSVDRHQKGFLRLFWTGQA